MGFFDGLSKKVSETTSSIQETTNKMQRESKCKKTVAENKSKIENAYSELGKKVYDKKNIDEELVKYIDEKVAEIDNLFKENEELQREILKLNNKKICPNCKIEVDINTTFCPQCGKEQEKIEIEQFIPNGKRKCSGCGEIIDDKNVFCPNCGAKKEEVEEAATKDEDVAKEVEVDANGEADAEKKVEE